MQESYTNRAIELLSQIISIPSVSKEEDKVADFICDYLKKEAIPFHRIKNNIWCTNKSYDASKITLLLNSHIDTVTPNKNYTRNPHEAEMEEGKLYGLGSNDAGASLVCLLFCFLNYYKKENLPFNLVFAASAEEEISGVNGMELLLKQLPHVEAAIVGEPTKMQLAVAENGLLVLNCKAKGTAGHAANFDGSSNDNAIYNAMKDIEWFKTYSFKKESKWLGKVRMQVTQINAGTQHNVVPDECNFVVDIRITDAYTHEEILEEIKKHVLCEIVARSMRLCATGINDNHFLVLAGKDCGLKTFGSNTLSDKALMPFPSVKIGIGDSLRSHTADEFVYINELEEGISVYIQFLNTVEKYLLNETVAKE
jgi:acetylornithine deacetylase